VVNTVAAERGASSAQVAIAWVRAQQERAVIVPIVGSRRREQIENSLAATDLELTADELTQLDAASTIGLGFPHDFPGRSMAYGNTYALTDGHRAQVWSDLT
jgi:diketogulonate reductase-like aldo/keto reductase